jgi:hypothetical protein
MNSYSTANRLIAYATLQSVVDLLHFPSAVRTGRAICLDGGVIA